jgi:hypothetical protein
MGNCSKKVFVTTKPDLMKVEKHSMVMDNEEVTVVKWENNSIKKPSGAQSPAEGFF